MTLLDANVWFSSQTLHQLKLFLYYSQIIQIQIQIQIILTYNIIRKSDIINIKYLSRIENSLE